MDRKTWFTGAASFLVMALAAGCGGTPPAAGSPSGAASAAARPASSTVSSAAASQSAGAAANGPIRVGYMEPLTGSFADVGKDNRDGFLLYLDSINRTVAGRKIDVQVIDTEAKPEVALTKAKQAVEGDKVQVLMGINSSAVCYAMAGYAKQAEMPLIVSGNCGAQKLTADPKFGSPYLVRLTQTATEFSPSADWAYQQGLRKAIIMTSDFAGGLEIGDATAARFVQDGGSVVQEIHPPLGTNDYGSYVAQMDPSADVVFDLLAGSDGLRFAQAFSDYGSQKKPVVFDVDGGVTAGPNLAQLKDKAAGMLVSNTYSEAYDGTANQAFLKAFTTKYPGRVVSSNVAVGYSAAQVLEGVLKQINGNIEQKQQFLNALYAMNVDTNRGTLKLDKYHDIVQNIYIYKIVKQGGGVAQQLLHTYANIDQFWGTSPDQLERLHLGEMKGKWVGMTKEKLQQQLKS